MTKIKRNLFIRKVENSLIWECGVINQIHIYKGESRFNRDVLYLTHSKEEAQRWLDEQGKQDDELQQSEAGDSKA